MLCLRVKGPGGDRRGRRRLGIRVGNAPVQVVAAEEDRETVLLARFQDDLGIPDLRDRLRERRAEFLVLLRGNASGAPVRDEAVFADGGEVPACGHVAASHGKPDAERLENAPADLVRERVIPEKRQMGGTASGRYPAADRVGHAAFRLGGQGVQVGRLRCLERGTPLHRYPADAIHHEEHNLA